MQYTIFELERIEKILQAKLEEAQNAYDARLPVARNNFRAHMIELKGCRSNIMFSGSAVGYIGEPVSGELSKAWKEFQAEDMDLVFLWGEVDLFERGINSLYSYWNSAVEIFIDKMRTRTEVEFPEAERKTVIDPNGEGEHEQS